MENNFSLMMLTATILFTTAACSSGSVPSDVDAASAVAAATTGSPLTLSSGGATAIYENQTMQLYVLGGTLPYVFSSTGGVVSTSYVYTAPATPGLYTVTVTDAAGAAAQFNVTVVDPSAANGVTGTTTTPTTTPITTTTPTAPASKIIYRFYNAATGIHSFSDVLQDSQGGALEGPAYLVLVNAEAGSVPLYRCALALPDGLTGFFDTTSGACEGQLVRAIYQLGYVYAGQNATGTLQPIYRFNLSYQLGDAPMIDHIEYPTNPLPPAVNWQSDQLIIGWVPVS